MRASLFAFVLLGIMGCDAADPAISVCHFPSGRPCSADTVCLGAKGDECNYITCEHQPTGEDVLVSGAVGCQAGVTAPVAGGPFDCDPSLIARDPSATGGFTPPNGTCPIGSLWALDTTRALPYLFCVPVAQCRPIACDPQYAGDGCPADYVCAAAAQTCVAP